ncbi:MAG: 8-oxo-dGTP diphosphatase [Spirochaetia bacterium]|jgi:8-oxo-dGTP diphosphatase|nr:8-oxo-dGTP diphosphatase [Spirochaetia bacterium]
MKFLTALSDNYLWILVAVLLVNLLQKRFPHSYKKRLATIYIALLLLIYNVLIILIIVKKLNPYLAIPAAVLLVFVGFLFRKHVWPFKLHCTSCGKRLNMDQILGNDDNLCSECYLKAHPEEAEKKRQEQEKQEELARQAAEEEKFVCPDTVDEIDWDSWEPEERCTLVYLIDGDKILLIEKKQGMGTGLVNGPGGHIELEETADEAAKREFTEETGLHVHEITKVGELNFQFKDGVSMRGYVYLGNGWDGELKSCDETTPFWCPLDELPVDKMWEDDRLWIRKAIQGDNFTGWFIFDGEKMLSKKLSFDEQE